MSEHGAQHQEESKTGEIKSKTAFQSSFWVVLILAGMFIAALNFIQVMGNEKHEGHEGKEQTSATIKQEEQHESSPVSDSSKILKEHSADVKDEVKGH